ncbi:hypothetical protein ACHQM5_026593 [Ranunculus cassubicifolius]
MILHNMYPITVDYGGSNHFHLIIRHIFAQAISYPSIKRRKLVLRLCHENSIFQPSLRFELSTIFSPYFLHSSHCIHAGDQFNSFL